MSQFSFWKAVNYIEVLCCFYPPDYQPVTEIDLFLPHGPLFSHIYVKCFTFFFTNQIRVHVDNINVTNKLYTMPKNTFTKQQNKQITLNYLNNNNITYYTHNNTIISFPTKSIQLNNLHCPHTKLIHHNNTTILIHNY